MWSKTRKALNDRVADCLKNRINYNFMVYTSPPYKWCTEMPRIHVYWNEINIADAINGEDYFYRMLAIIDRQLGKRSIKKLLDT